MTADELLTRTEVIGMFALDEDTLDGGSGPAGFQLGARVVYRRADVEAWVAAQTARLGEQ